MTKARTGKIRRLLFLSCTRRKRHDPDLLPAVERYDGPIFRVVRRFREKTAQLPETYVLSAQFGLIESDRLIPYYDEQMTPQRARELRPQVEEAFRQIISAAPPWELAKYQLLFCMGKVYFETLMPCVPPHLAIEHAQGPIGRMSAELHQWLHGPSAYKYLVSRAESPNGVARLRGVEVRLTPDEIIKVARRAFPQQRDTAAIYYSWFVWVDQERVSPKWLVSLITGLPVSAFHSDEARRTLERLGVKVFRTEF